jgi:cell division protein FtsB
VRKRIQRAPQLLVSRLEEAGISGRVFIVLLALFIAALTLAPPVKNYFVQRAQISALQANVSDNAQQLAAARAELEQWKDTSYIKTQARKRLHFVLPGEREYIVIGVTGTASNSLSTAAPVSEQFPLGIPWYSRVISSITSVGASGG